MPTGVRDPERATVRPRVIVDDASFPRLLDEEVEALLAAGAPANVWLVGGRGSGRTTALQHLAGTFGSDDRLRLVDEGERVVKDGALVTVAACSGILSGARVLHLAPWDEDDVLEYLVRTHRDRAPELLAAWRAQPIDLQLGHWPGLVRTLLAMLAERRAGDLLPALRLLVDEQLPPGERDAAQATALGRSTRRSSGSLRSPKPEWPLLAIPIVRALLAAEHALDLLEHGSPLPLKELHWSRELRLALGLHLLEDPACASRLTALCDGAAPELAGSIMSLLCAAHPALCPKPAAFTGIPHVNLADADLRNIRVGGELHFADLSGADLTGAEFLGVNMRFANLYRTRLDAAQVHDLRAFGSNATHLSARGATFERCFLLRCNLAHADFEAAELQHLGARDAVLDHACFAGSDLSNCDLGTASFRSTDLRGARLCDADLVGRDLRSARLDRVTLDRAKLDDADLSQSSVDGLRADLASFKGSWLTGARWRGAALAKADFTEAALAEVDWEGADLRGCDFTNATFHLGSTRSGLVGSAIAGEGSRTGFYTDESAEDRFKAPEEVRKANLCGTDLRGANIESCDFYLVDLRGAKLDPHQLQWLRRCRAILGPRR